MTFGEMAHLARSGSQSHRAIWFILPARGASHIINKVIVNLLPVLLFHQRKINAGLARIVVVSNFS